MAFPKGLLKFSGSSLLCGIGIALVLPKAMPALAKIARPAAKSAIKGYLKLAGSVKDAVVQAGEIVSDIIAEAKAEMSASRSVPAAAASDPMVKPAA